MEKRPRVLLAAAKSGSGKTMICCGLLEHLKRTGADPVSFKCGPDYIDPMFHKRVLGIESDNLDTFFSDREAVRRMVAGSDGGCVCIEGVMGIYDGSSPSGIAGSCYQTAEYTDTPIILIIDARGVGRTVISLIKGILGDDEKGLIKGLILNRMSKSYYERLKPCLEEELVKTGKDLKLLGFVPQLKDVGFDSRHLGLKLPSEIEDIAGKLGRVADALEENCDTEALRDIMDTAPDIEAGEKRVDIISRDKACKLAVAMDEAFCFYYRENLKILSGLGAEIEYFSPLHDKSLPEGVKGILLGGGYPELHAKELGDNVTMRDDIRKHVLNGIPCLAECGGFMYLHESLRLEDGTEYPMAGVIEGGVCYPAGQLLRFGYMEIEECRNGYYRGIEGLKGHEFHYYESSACGQECTALKRTTDKRWECMGGDGGSLWGFPHFYYASNPLIAERFVEAMRL